MHLYICMGAHQGLERRCTEHTRRVEEDIRVEFDAGKLGSGPRDPGGPSLHSPAANKYTKLRGAWNGASLSAKNITHR